MTPENQSDTPNPKPTEEEVRKAEDIVTDSELGVHDVDSGMIYDTQKIINGIAQALAEQRQSWEKEKYDLLTYGANQAELIAKLEKEKSGLEERLSSIQKRFDERYYTPNEHDQYLIKKPLREEISRLKARNEELEKKLEYFQSQFNHYHTLAEKVTLENERLIRGYEYEKDLCLKVIKLKYDMETCLIASLAAAHEALEPFSKQYQQYGKHGILSHQVYMNAVKALADPTGKQALERMKRVKGYLREIKNCGCFTEITHIQEIAGKALEALDASEGGVN